MRSTVPAQVTSSERPACSRKGGGMRMRPTLSTGHSCAGATKLRTRSRTDGSEERERRDLLGEGGPLRGRVGLQAGVEQIGGHEELVRALRREHLAKARRQAGPPLRVDLVLVDAGERHDPWLLDPRLGPSFHFFPLRSTACADSTKAPG